MNIRLLHDKEFVCVTEDIVKETLLKMPPFFQNILRVKKQTSSYIYVQLLLLAVRYSHCLQRS